MKRGDELVEIETDKANMTYEADADGVLIEIVAQEGDTLPIGEVIARIGEAAEKVRGRRPGAGGRRPGRRDRRRGRAEPAAEAEARV